MKLGTVKATVAMADKIGYIQAKSWQAAYKGIVPAEYLATFTSEKRADIFRKVMPARSEEFYLFSTHDQPSGMAILGKARDEDLPDTTGEISAIYFLPDAWGTGCSVPAIWFCLTRLRELGYAQVILWVLKDNPRARRFYEKAGFHFDGAIKEINIGKPLIELRYSFTFPS
ncbi:GNAT family N-acetyltransferase [Sporomusa termitida]|uniref:N-acetyltransferase domain-containing protein n=1 Tax=Sporomusa termitida TaxID=2377 RepID=A0A517DR96_9FIRM|nr:GNAT family N-acetyltransferase [Sporomusa termitida]QDR79883.1 hypothetical protein SPTER_11850 [Sporomusa termitida]